MVQLAWKKVLKNSFQSVEECLTFKNDWMCAFFFLLFVVWTLYSICILHVLLFLCYLHSILKTYLSVVSSFCFVVAAFICMFCIGITYSTSCRCHYKLLDLSNVRTSGSIECAYVCTILHNYFSSCGTCKDLVLTLYYNPNGRTSNTTYFKVQLSAALT
jgi:hypothetical protein